MTDGSFQSRVLHELGSLGKDVSGLRGEVAAVREDVSGLKVTVARIEEQHKTSSRRLGQLERWRDDRDDAQEATGRDQVRALQKQLAQEIRQHREEAANRNRVLLGYGVKAALLLLGAALASPSPALARALGVGP